MGQRNPRLAASHPVDSILRKEELAADLSRGPLVGRELGSDSSPASPVPSPVTVTIGLTSQIAVSSSGEPVAGLNCSLPDISAIGQVMGGRGCNSPPAIRYRSTSPLFLPAYYPPTNPTTSPLVNKCHSNDTLAKPSVYRKASPSHKQLQSKKLPNNLKKPSTSTGATSHQSCRCGSKVTVNGQHHCDFLLSPPS